MLMLSLALVAMAQVLHAEKLRVIPDGQSGAISGVGSHGVDPRGIPPHAPGYLGILFHDLTDEQVTSLRMKTSRGVEVVMVDHDGPAGKAGFQPHDVIVSLNGQNVVNAETLRRMIHDAGAGADVTLTLLRGGRKITVNTQLAYRGEVEREAATRMAAADPVMSGDAALMEGTSLDGEESDSLDPPPPVRNRSFLLQMLHFTPFTGLMLESMEPQLAGFFGAPAGVGLLVETVEPGSPAAAAGLRAGDVILKADSIEVKSNGAWVRRLHASRGRGIALVVLRDRQEQTIMLIPELKKHSLVELPELFAPLPQVA